MLIIMKDWYVEEFSKPRLNLEAPRSGDVLEVDPAIDRRDQLDGSDDLIDILGIETNWPCVDVSKTLEERCLSLHHRERCFRAEIAKTKYS